MVNVASLLHESVVVAVVGWHSVRGAHCFSDLNIAGNMSIVLTHEGNCLSFTIWGVQCRICHLCSVPQNTICAQLVLCWTESMIEQWWDERENWMEQTIFLTVQKKLDWTLNLNDNFLWLHLNLYLELVVVASLDTLHDSLQFQWFLQLSLFCDGMEHKPLCHKKHSLSLVQ